MQVMNNLATPSAVGAGISVAFVATVYGLGLANLLLLPIAGRLRERALAATSRREMIVDAIIALQQRRNPRLVAQALRAVVPELPRVDEILMRPPFPAGLARASA
jgi:chemotaxis protein MotA